ncbi:hypothetical protein [Gimesia sp.]|uniref:hypothetical protein n=1 Tax=Gimesia sp. TaxID=2024833 RepID=UPI000C43AAE4|nr:hypothetical protein [Gimesia sp.]MAX39457.1 hypothetical protein [Gimesia sp.]HAH48423.1 hypothetical protein [Planctomycetaceae bacterium]HBL46307.1 hypothetical protein [Planctomycetaceae bacterium]|tara:strand:+ start:19984 stop:20859 length:876 start_codon:yes stop_codon:yes gene_type:complete
MISRRRLTFQLTPLLDLLLIVIFAQFMDTQETTARIEQRSQQQVTQAEQEAKTLREEQRIAHRKLAELNRSNRQLLLDAMQAEKNAIEIQKQARAKAQLTEKQNRELSEQLEQTREQRNLVGEMVQQLFQLPDSLLDPLLNAKPDPESEQTKKEIERIKKQLQELAGGKAIDVVKHFLTYDELTKRSDIWELYLTENGVFRLKIGDQSAEFRADSPQEFVDRFYAVYKTVPQPKSLVIILFSYGDARASLRFAATQGLPLVAERMRTDSSGRTRYEYAVMGFAPESVPVSP